MISDFAGGIDTVQTSLASYALASDLENLTGIGNVDQSLTGNAKANIIDGGLGADTMTGGDGNDIYHVDNVSDSVVEGSSGSSGVDEVRTNLDFYVLANNVENLTGTLAAGQGLVGNSLINTITGAAGADDLVGGRGDTLNGNGGGDLLEFDLLAFSGGFNPGAPVSIANGGGGGTDMLLLDFSLYGGAVTIGIGADASGGHAGAFMDSEQSFPTNVLVSFSSIETFVLIGTAKADTLTTGAGNDKIKAGGGDDVLDGGAGSDTIILSGDRADYTVSDMGGGNYRITDNRAGGTEGTDTFRNFEKLQFHNGTFLLSTFFDQPPALSAPASATVTYTEDGPAAALLQGVTLSDPDAPADFAGGSLGLTVGGAGGGLNLRAGTDFRVNSNGDGSFSLAIQVGATQIGIGTISGIGTLGVQITGLTAQATAARVNNLIDDFIYINLSDAPVAGDRSVTLTFTDAAAHSVQQTQTLTVVAQDDAPLATADAVSAGEASPAAGNVLANDSDVDGPALAVAAVNGSAANVGTQIALASGALLTLNADGTFAYDPNHAFDATPAAGSGAIGTTATDSFSYTLVGGGTATVTVSIAGADSNDVLLGTVGADTLSAGIGNDFIDGLAGADNMFGGAGDDVYVVDSAADVVVEGAGQGRDVVYARLSYGLAAGASIEILSVSDQSGTAALELVGNELGQEIYGNAGTNFLQGGGGTDYLIGLGGDDRYLVVGSGDHVVESAGGGARDVIYAAIDYALFDGLDIEVLSSSNQAGTGAQSLIGNALAQEIYGNQGANFIDGGAGADYLAGLGGNDTYVVDNAGDVVAEAGGGGRDVVYAQASYALAAGQEIEVLSTSSQAGTAAIDLTGNAFANELYGNAGANVLNGGAGADYLAGYGGADVFAFTTALGNGNVDHIADFLSGTDTIALDDAVFAGLGLGALGANAFVVGATAQDADDRIVYDSATGQLFFDADGNGADAAVQFATLESHPLVAASDFMVI